MCATSSSTSVLGSVIVRAPGLDPVFGERAKWTVAAAVIGYETAECRPQLSVAVQITIK
jgi:hypothetical protein